jgi:hypothetical protein
MKIYNLVVIDNNAGETLVSPFDYFDFPVETVKLNLGSNDFDYESLEGKFIVYGGGGAIHIPSEDYNDGIFKGVEIISDLSPWLVAWGVGHNIHGSTKIKYPESFLTKFRLIGVRDIGQVGVLKDGQHHNLPWVPCVSCMDELFHHKYEIKHSIVATGHFLDSYNLGVPSIEHVGTPAEEVIPFIASGETVLTNSYHGAYWGLLLNRKVIVFNPMSSKFYGLPPQIVLATPGTWEDAKPTNNDQFLPLCRSVNEAYHKQVLNLLEEYLET